MDTGYKQAIYFVAYWKAFSIEITNSQQAKSIMASHMKYLQITNAKWYIRL